MDPKVLGSNQANCFLQVVPSASAPAVEAFESLKKTIEEAVVTAIDETIPFEVETDASEVALAATLNQNGKPVAFFSRTLQGSELKHASIEKEAQAIIEAVRHWRHFLTGRHFILKTDQKSVSYMFDKQHSGKIKNEKFLRWRLELSCFSFDIVYRPGRDNVPADTLSRTTCAMATEDSLFKLHEALCHPGITRLNHFVRTKNLPYSVDEIKKMTSRCPICCECKPQYHRPEKVPLIKATQPFERINIDFKGPLPTNNGNKYFLMVVDEYSRFPFVFPCPDVSTNTVIKCLTSLFSLVGMPAYVHSDRGASFMSRELREFLTSKGVGFKSNYQLQPRRKWSSGEMQWCDMESSYYEFEIKEPTISGTGKMSSRMCYTPSALFCVLPPMKLHMSDSLVSHADRPLAPPFLPG